MKTIVLLTFLAVTASAQNFGDVEYFQRVPGKDKAEKVDGKLLFDRSGNAVQFMQKDKTLLKVPNANVTNLVYERAAKPRYAAGLLVAWPLLLTKSKSHFLTIQYKDEASQGQYGVFKLHKSNYREVLAAAEASTGKQVQRTEER